MLAPIISQVNLAPNAFAFTVSPYYGIGKLVGVSSMAGAFVGAASLGCQGKIQTVGIAVGVSGVAPVGSSWAEPGVAVGSKIDRMGVGAIVGIVAGAVGLMSSTSRVGVAVVGDSIGGCSGGMGVGSGGVSGRGSWVAVCGS